MRSKELAIGCGVGIALLLLALAPLPYGFYILLRLAICPLLAWCAYEYRRRLWMVIPLVLLALLYNPLVRVPFKRGSWEIINGVTIACLIVPLAISTRRRKEPAALAPTD